MTIPELRAARRSPSETPAGEAASGLVKIIGTNEVPRKRKEPHIPTRTHFRSMVLAAVAALVCWGCYPKAVGPTGPEGNRLTWEQMNLEQRKNHMRTEVLPRVAVIFGEWRPERYATVNCGLCHPGHRDGDFRMPADHLPRLSGELLLGPEFASDPDTTRLKLDRLVPAMTEALGLKPFSLVTRRGFGCYSCHLGPSGPMFGN